MVNTKMEFKHPQYYKNLRKLARLRNRDQAISLQAATAEAGRTPGTGLKQSNNAGTLISRLCNKRKGGIGSEVDEPSSSQAGGRVGPKGSSLQASPQASSGARINKRWI